MKLRNVAAMARKEARHMLRDEDGSETARRQIESVDEAGIAAALKDEAKERQRQPHADAGGRAGRENGNETRRAPARHAACETHR